MNAAHSSPGEVLFALPVEGLDNQRLHEFAVLCSPSAPSLIVTQQRARAIGIEASALPLSEAAGDIVVLSAQRGSFHCGLCCRGGDPARQA